MSRVDHKFLFASLNSKQPRTARKTHLRRLFDILQICLLRKDYDRARRAWAILIRCREFNWKDMWKTAAALLGHAGNDESEDNDQRITFLSTMMRQHPDDRETVLRELVLQLIHVGAYRRALDELDLYLPSFPYQDNTVLHIYAGLLALYLSQPRQNLGLQSGQPWDAGLLRDAQTHFRRARAIDPDNMISAAFIGQLPNITQVPQAYSASESDDEGEDENIDIDTDMDRTRKRVKA